MYIVLYIYIYEIQNYWLPSSDKIGTMLAVDRVRVPGPGSTSM